MSEEKAKIPTAREDVAEGYRQRPAERRKLFEQIVVTPEPAQVIEEKQEDENAKS